VKTLLAAVVGVVLLVSGASAQSPVWSAPEDVGVVISSITVGSDSCIAESVTFNGDFTMEVTTMTDEAGQTHIRSTLPHFNISATGSAGGQYTALIVSKLVESISEAEGGIEATQIWRLQVSGQGSANNETVFMTTHVTNPNPNSQSTGVNVLHMGDRCNGK
jgi:hypothetical protein